MLRWMMTLMCAFSVAAVAGAQDDDLDALLAGLGDDDSFAEAAPEAGTVEVEETAVAEEDPFADLFSEAEAVTEMAEEASAEADALAEDAAGDVAAFADDAGVAMAEAADDGAAAVETAATDVADAFGDDAFADFFDDFPAEAEAPAETVTAAEVTEATPEAGDDFAEFADFAEDFEDATSEAADAAAEAADAAAEIPEAVEAGIDDAFAEEDFGDFMDDFSEEVQAEEVAEAAVDTLDAAVDEVAETADDFAGDFAEGFAEPVDEAAGDFSEALPEAEPVDEAIDDFAEAVPEAEPMPEPEADSLAEVAAEQAAIEQLAAEAETAIDEAEFATVEEGEAAAAAITGRVRPVEPDVKPAKEKKAKKDKFSSESRKPLKPKTSVPAWDEPVTLDGSEPSAPAAAPAAKPAKRASRGDWDEPVVW